jgi:hypothetical protein
MKKTILVALAVLPLAAFAQTQPPQNGPPAGPGRWGRNGQPDAARVERVEKRMRLARTLGLAEALDLDAPQALKLGETLSKFDERRLAAHKQMFEARQVLRRAAQGEKIAPAEVDQAIQKAFDARGQIQAIDKESFAAVSKDLSPEKKARAVLFLGKFQNRFGPRGGRHGMGPGMGGPGMPGGRGRGPGNGMGPGGGQGPGAGMGPGPGAMGMMGPGDGAPMDDDGGLWADEDD